MPPDQTSSEGSRISVHEAFICLISQEYTSIRTSEAKDTSFHHTLFALTGATTGRKDADFSPTPVSHKQGEASFAGFD